MLVETYLNTLFLKIGLGVFDTHVIAHPAGKQGSVDARPDIHATDVIRQPHLPQQLLQLANPLGLLVALLHCANANALESVALFAQPFHLTPQPVDDGLGVG